LQVTQEEGFLPGNDKTNGIALGWRRLKTTYPYSHSNHMFRVRKDWVRWPDGHEGGYAYVECQEAVWVVPVTADGQVILIRQFRYTIDEWSWEVPAGGFHDFEGSPIELAKRELAEEVGGTSEDWHYVGFFRPGVSTVDAIDHICLAREVQLDRPPDPEPGEIIEVHQMPLERALEMARNGEMVDGNSALALLRCEPYLGTSSDDE
jgi:ADP-ribose pyrophosphatase